MNLDERVRQALTLQDMCHREPDAYALLAAVRRKITEVSGGASSHSAVVLTGSGTSAIEATLSSVVPPDGELLILSNGHFGERLAAVAEIYRLPSRVWDEGWGHTYDFDGIERLLVDNPSITHVAMVHHETSTGQLNDVRRVGELTAALDRCLIVDAVSSLGGEDLDVARDHIDWCVTSSNKCVEAPPGLAFVIGATERVSELEHIPERSLYLSLCRHYESQAARGVPLFTPSLPLMSSALCALELLVAEGVLQRRARYRQLAQTLRAGLAQLGLPLYLPDPSTRASTSTNVALPTGVSFEELRQELRAAGYVVYPCDDELPGYFRVANMGQVALEDIEAFLARMSERRRLAA